MGGSYESYFHRPIAVAATRSTPGGKETAAKSDCERVGVPTHFTVALTRRQTRRRRYHHVEAREILRSAAQAEAGHRAMVHRRGRSVPGAPRRRRIHRDHDLRAGQPAQGSPHALRLRSSRAREGADGSHRRRRRGPHRAHDGRAQRARRGLPGAPRRGMQLPRQVPQGQDRRRLRARERPRRARGEDRPRR